MFELPFEHLEDDFVCGLKHSDRSRAKLPTQALILPGHLRAQVPQALV